MVPQDITRIVWVSDPQISPDGARVAFVATTLSEERDEYLSNIWVADVGGGGVPRRFTAGPKRDRDPRWSPDGTRLAFVSEREGKKKGQLYVMPADGGEPTRLSDERHGVADPVWSPDGSRLAFVARVGGYHPPEREEDKQKSRPARVITTLKYRYNGEGFTYDRRRHVFVVAAAGGPARQLTDGEWDDADPAWSPDGRIIAFSSARHPDRDLDDSSDLWLVDADGGEARRITDTLGPAVLPAFSPDGRTIAYLGRRSKNEYGRNVRVFTMATDGGTPRCLTLGLDRSCAPLGTRPIWSPDGRSIIFAAEDQGALGVYRVGTKDGDGAGAVDRRRARGDRLLALRRIVAESPSRPPILSRRPRCSSPSGDGGRRAPAHRHERRLAGRGGARAPGALPLRARRILDRRLGDEAPRVPRGCRVAGPAQHPRRPARAVRPRVLRRVPGLRGRGLRGDLCQPARQPGLWRGVHARGDRRLGRRRLRRRHGRARPGPRPPRVDRSRRGSA